MLILCGGASLLPSLLFAQCPMGTLKSATYRTTLIGTGGNTFTTTDLPQFNPSPQGYTLLSAVVSAKASSSAAISFTNNGPGSQDIYFGISRQEVVKLGAALVGPPSTVIWGDNPEIQLNPAGTAGDQASYGPQPVFDTSATVFYDSISSAGTLTGSYQGGGNLNFSYKTTTFINSVPANVQALATIADTVIFSVTYYYCDPTTLSSDILTFTAVRENDQMVLLNWITANEHAGRKYKVEVSNDGKNFIDYAEVAAGTVNEDASYSYNYPIGPSARGQLYFRLRSVDIAGGDHLSQIRIIDLGTGTGTGSGFSIYPNPPSDFLNLLFPPGVQGWQVEILTADGGLLQRNYYHNTGSGRLNFQHLLAAGTYFVRAMDLQTAKNYIASFVIH
jgi:hypothetical protein